MIQPHVQVRCDNQLSPTSSTDGKKLFNQEPTFSPGNETASESPRHPGVPGQGDARYGSHLAESNMASHKGVVVWGVGNQSLGLVQGSSSG